MDGDLTYDRRSGWTIFELELPDAADEPDVSLLEELAQREGQSTASDHEGDLRGRRPRARMTPAVVCRRAN